MTVQQKLSELHRRLRKPGRKNNKRKKAKNNSHSYEALELRRMLSANSAPVGQNDLLYATDVDVLLTVDVVENGLLANDSDLDVEIAGGGGPFGGGPALTAVNFPMTTTAGGTLVAIDDGTFTYMPLAGYEGFDSFSYQVSDGSLLSEVWQPVCTIGR